MRYSIRNHPLIERDIFDIVDLISNYAGLAVGLSKVDQITDFISRLEEFPHIGTVREGPHAGIRAVSATEKAVVCFTVDEETKTVYILCISYAGSDWMSEV